MLMSFKTEMVWVIGDLEELAYRLTGQGGYSQETVLSAFFHTFVDGTESHRDVIARAIAEDTSVASYDEIDSFTTEITIDSTKYIYTYSY